MGTDNGQGLPATPDLPEIPELKQTRESTTGWAKRSIPGAGIPEWRLRTYKAPKMRHRLQEPRAITQVHPKLRELLRAYIDGDVPWPLYLYGKPGTGKTCAALAFLDFVADPTVYLTMAELMERINAAEFKADRLEQVFRPILEARCVVLDEIGARERVPDAHYEALKKILDGRQRRPLIVIGNLDLPGIAKVYDDRITSRLSCGCVREVGGPDRRKAKG